MNSSPVEKLLAAVRTTTGHEPTPTPKGWQSCCPAHDDRRPSLSIAEGYDGRALLRCHAGCTVKAIVSALGLTMRDLRSVDSVDGDNTPRHGLESRVLSAPPKAKTAKTYETAKGAVATLERQYGKRTASWTYHDANGEPVGVVVRWNTDRGKIVRPVTRNGDGWVIGGMPSPRPLYRLPELLARDTKRVFVVEGEKAADAVQSLGLLATTSPHGSSSASKANWQPLAGRDVILLPDNDAPGSRYAGDVSRILSELNPPATVRVVTLPGLPTAGDAVEYIAARRADGLDNDAIRKAIETLANVAEPVEFERTIPSVEAYRPFPVDALPEPVRSFVTDGANTLGCDASYVALPLLAGLASAIGNTRRIQLKPGWTEPAILWVAIVGDSGTMKSPAIELALKPIRKRQREAMRRYSDKMEVHQVETTLYERSMADWKRSKDDIGPPAKPELPIADRCWCDDTTIESLAALLQNQWRGLLVVRDELSGWVASFDRYAQGRGGDVAKWLEMFSARPMVIDRKTGTTPTTNIDRAAVCLVGGIQPGVLRRALGTQHRENGLAARLLLAYPPRRAKRWTEATIAQATRTAMDNVFDRLFGLEPNRDENDNPCPLNVTLTRKGKQAWVAFYREHSAESVGLTGDLASVASKIEGYAARLALVVHFIRWAAGDPTLADSGAADEKSIAAGVMLARWFMREAQRVYGILGESDDDGQLRQLIELIERKGGDITPRELVQSSRLYSTVVDARVAIERLIDAGLGTWKQAIIGPHGGKPSKRFILDNPPVYDTPAGAIETAGIVDVDTVDARNTASLITVDDREMLTPSRLEWAKQ